VKGGVGKQESQIAMMRFSRWSSTEFGFDRSHTTEGVVQAIDSTYFHGGYRSNIGQALSQANSWVFQQAAGLCN